MDRYTGLGIPLKFFGEVYWGALNILMRKKAFHMVRCFNWVLGLFSASLTSSPLALFFAMAATDKFSSNLLYFRSVLLHFLDFTQNSGCRIKTVLKFNSKRLG